MKSMLILILMIMFILVTNNDDKLKVTSRIKAQEEIKVDHPYTSQYFRKFFSFNTPINKCMPENCEFCCLSLNFCGSKQQCENSYYTMNIFRVMFITVTVILVTLLIYKIYITDSDPEHTDEDKIEEKSLNLLIGLFMHNRENRRKFKP